MSSYHVCTESHGHKNLRNGSFFVFSVDDSKKLVMGKIIKHTQVSK